MSMTINEIKRAKRRLEADLSAAVESILRDWISDTDVMVSDLTFSKNALLTMADDPLRQLPSIARVELDLGI